MKLVLALLLACTASAQLLTTVTGTLAYPNGTAVNGKLTVQLTRSTIINSCVSQSVVPFRPVTVPIVNGTLGTLNLIPSQCLSQGTSAPATAILGAGAGQAATKSISGSAFGVLTITTGTAPKINAQIASIVLNLAGKGNYCTLFPYGTSASLSGITFSTNDTNNLKIFSTSPALAASTIYTWQYSCILPYQVTVVDASNQRLYDTMWRVSQTSPQSITTVDVANPLGLIP